jgi:hypothetical protein
MRPVFAFVENLAGLSKDGLILCIGETELGRTVQHRVDTTYTGGYRPAR